MSKVYELAIAVKKAAPAIRLAPTAQKNMALSAMATALREGCENILKGNEADMAAAQAAGMSVSLQDRLRLTEQRVEQMAQALEQVALLADPIGEVMEGRRLPNGLELTKVRVPLGVIGIIYEARPNVTAEAAALCIKAGNAVLLRGGKEALNSNLQIAACLRQGLKEAGLPEDGIGLVTDTDRESAAEMMRLRGVLDVLIPRGGAGLIQAVATQATVPVIETGVGNCHIYVDETANLSMAVKIIVNAKTSRPSVCNAAESLLVHEAVAAALLPALAEAMPQVTLHGCERTQQILPEALAATEEDYGCEYLDYQMSVKVVTSLEDAMAHIAQYSTGHSEAIITTNTAHAEAFTRGVDAAAVYVNASTRFTDGGEFGLGAEIGISTQKLHARGPMGLRELTSNQYIIRGSGQIR